jgi:hypothetical protein
VRKRGLREQERRPGINPPVAIKALRGGLCQRTHLHKARRAYQDVDPTKDLRGSSNDGFGCTIVLEIG